MRHKTANIGFISDFQRAKKHDHEKHAAEYVKLTEFDSFMCFSGFDFLRVHQGYQLKKYDKN